MRRIGQLALVASMSVGGVLASTSAANAAVCQNAYSIAIPGGYAVINECYRNGNEVQVSGSVTDRDADGRCARVYAKYNVYSGTDYSPQACPEGQTDYFTFPWRAGTDAFVYLQNI